MPITSLFRSKPKETTSEKRAKTLIGTWNPTAESNAIAARLDQRAAAAGDGGGGPTPAVRVPTFETPMSTVNFATIPLPPYERGNWSTPIQDPILLKKAVYCHGVLPRQGERPSVTRHNQQVYPGDEEETDEEDSNPTPRPDDYRGLNSAMGVLRLPFGSAAPSVSTRAGTDTCPTSPNPPLIFDPGELDAKIRQSLYGGALEEPQWKPFTLAGVKLDAMPAMNYQQAVLPSVPNGGSASSAPDLTGHQQAGGSRYTQTPAAPQYRNQPESNPNGQKQQAQNRRPKTAPSSQSSIKAPPPVPPKERPHNQEQKYTNDRGQRDHPQTDYERHKRGESSRPRSKTKQEEHIGEHLVEHIELKSPPRAQKGSGGSPRKNGGQHYAEPMYEVAPQSPIDTSHRKNETVSKSDKHHDMKDRHPTRNSTRDSIVDERPHIKYPGTPHPNGKLGRGYWDHGTGILFHDRKLVELAADQDESEESEENEESEEESETETVYETTKSNAHNSRREPATERKENKKAEQNHKSPTAQQLTRHEKASSPSSTSAHSTTRDQHAEGKASRSRESASPIHKSSRGANRKYPPTSGSPTKGAKYPHGYSPSQARAIDSVPLYSKNPYVTPVPVLYFSDNGSAFKIKLDGRTFFVDLVSLRNADPSKPLEIYPDEEATIKSRRSFEALDVNAIIERGYDQMKPTRKPRARSMSTPQVEERGHSDTFRIRPCSPPSEDPSIPSYAKKLRTLPQGKLHEGWWCREGHRRVSAQCIWVAAAQQGLDHYPAKGWVHHDGWYIPFSNPAEAPRKLKVQDVWIYASDAPDMLADIASGNNSPCSIKQ